MSNGWQAAASAGTGIAGPVIGGLFNRQGQIEANNANAKAAQDAMDFSKEQSGTTWSRAVLDMRRAGLNPALAYGQGPASAASGSTYNAGNPYSEMSRSIGAGISSAGDIVRSFREADALKSTLALQDSSVALNAASAVQALENAKNLSVGRRKLGFESDSAEVNAEADKMVGGVGKLIGRVAGNLPFGDIIKKLPIKGKK